MGVSQLSVSMGSWIVQLLFCFLIVSFRILGPLLRWVFLLGKPLGGRC